MKKIILDEGEYSFDASAKQVKLLAHTDLLKGEYLLLITNTTQNQIIYNFGCDGYGATIDKTSNVITLEYDTSSMLDSDSLQIIMYTESDDADTETHRLLDVIRLNTNLQQEILEELQKCSKYLRKIYNPE